MPQKPRAELAAHAKPNPEYDFGTVGARGRNAARIAKRQGSLCF